MKRSSALFLALAALAAPASAKDIGKIDRAPIRLDVTETALVNWHGDNLNTVKRVDDNYGEFINRLNALLAWKAFQFGIRFDTAVYANAPRISEFRDPNNGYSPNDVSTAEQQLPYRYRDTGLIQGNLKPSARDPSVWPSKIWASYVKPKFELTVGDAYVSFGRGFVLNIRKFDEIGADTTLQGTKIVGRVESLTLTHVMGLTNPTRVDDATGFKLADAPVRCEESSSARCRDGYGLPWQTWSRDLIIGDRVEAKLGTSTIGIHGSNVRRRDRRDDPDAPRQLYQDDPSFVRDVTSAGINLSMPKLAPSVPVNLYTELAYQRRGALDRGDPISHGYAAYVAASYTAGPITTSFEGKHYRHMNPVRLNADKSRYFAFQAVQYTANPTVELITQDSLFDNSCTTGARTRFDLKPLKTYSLFASAARFANWQQGCGAQPTLGISSVQDATERRDITDFYIGFELRSAHEGSYVSVLMGTRRENRADGSSYYREGWVQANGSKVITGKWSVEVDAWHRNRYLNLEQWREGQTYLALKYASRYSAVVGHEYSTRPSQITPAGVAAADSDPMRVLRFLPTNGVQHFLNVGGQVKFSDEVMLRFLFGEQRAALKCVSGVCRFFPAFAGARTELIIRY